MLIVVESSKIGVIKSNKLFFIFSVSFNKFIIIVNIIIVCLQNPTKGIDDAPLRHHSIEEKCGSDGGT